jgi:hypothetical protein
MPTLDRYLRAARDVATDVPRWLRGGQTGVDTYRLVRSLHRVTAGRSSQALRTVARHLPGHPDRLGPADAPRLDERATRALDDLRRDGLAHLDPMLDPDDVAELAEYARTAPARVVLADGTSRVGTYEELRAEASAVFLDGRFAWARPEVQRLLASPRIWDLARAYFGLVPVVHPPQIYWSCTASVDEPDLRRSLARNFHWDYDGIGGLRLHLYLTDVDETAAPMEYVLGSHRPGTLSTPELRAADGGDTPESALDALGLVERVPVTGPAGTTFISDSSGLHRATRPTGRDRLFLVMPIRAGNLAGYYRRRRAVPVRDETFGRALAAARPELQLFVAAGPEARVVTLADQLAS